MMNYIDKLANINNAINKLDTDIEYNPVIDLKRASESLSIKQNPFILGALEYMHQFNAFDASLLNHNLKTMTFDNESLVRYNHQHKVDRVGCYQPEINRLQVLENDIRVYAHELLHVSSSKHIANANRFVIKSGHCLVYQDIENYLSHGENELVIIGNGMNELYLDYFLGEHLGVDNRIYQQVYPIFKKLEILLQANMDSFFQAQPLNILLAMSQYFDLDRLADIYDNFEAMYEMLVLNKNNYNREALKTLMFETEMLIDYAYYSSDYNKSRVLVKTS